jgi:poly-gamma-glutamate synthesis protein (capsule biosynthesis protein)
VSAGRHRPGIPGIGNPLPILWLVIALAVVVVGIVLLSPARLSLFGRAGPDGDATGPVAGPSPSPTPPAPPPKGQLLVHATGDVNLDPSYIPNFQTHGYGYAWSGLGGLFQRDDLTIVNLECPMSNLGSPVPKEFNFRGDPAALPSMREAGVEVANQGNNHAQDYGPEAMLDSRRNLRAHDIAPVGTGRNAKEAAAPAILKVDGWTVAVVGFGGVVPEPGWLAGPDHPGMADGDDIPSMVAAVRAASARADLVFVAIHWGVELDTSPRAEDVERARAMIDAGADAIFGHHSHRLNPMDTYRGRPIFWSLGNFVWPDHSYEGAVTAVAEVRVSPAGKVAGRLLPAFIEDAGHPVLR